MLSPLLPGTDSPDRLSPRSFLGLHEELSSCQVFVTNRCEWGHKGTAPDSTLLFEGDDIETRPPGKPNVFACSCTV